NERKVVQELFEYLGGRLEELDTSTIRLNARQVTQAHIPDELCRRNRISVLCAGPLLHRFREVTIANTLGGDQIGRRPVDFHLKGLEEMGAQVETTASTYRFRVGEAGLHGARLVLPFPSVMTTEHLVMTATLARGRTVIENAATEPEIIELVKMLQKMGADIMVDQHRTIVVQGVPRLKGCELTCMVDRNQAVSFGCAALATGGDVLLAGVSHDSIYSFLNFIQRMGAEFQVTSEGVRVNAPRPLSATHVEVEVHPGFMTDWQQPFTVLFTQASGTSVLHETIFEDRLGYTRFLSKMGANITLFAKCLGEVPCRFRGRNHIHSAIVQGPTPLSAGDFVLPTDIRAGMCLVIAGLVAQGTTRLSNIHELQRKYDHLVQKLCALGADVTVTSGSKG
ncbi:MAG TPA: UDP-N-acetylglucosamine 1-carboxyvinyltransferase, partial [Polyangiaceae bacterium]|nr:UDP-N-acetylglucosamine 1-carboxyvinyltransferase [Polyangiaceae bacterium]